MHGVYWGGMRKQWRQWLLVGVLLVVALWLGSLIWGIAQKAEVAVREATETKAAYEELENRKAALTGELEFLKTARGQEAAIREAFGVAKVGEEVIVVVPQSPATTTEPHKTWWEEWFGW